MAVGLPACGDVTSDGGDNVFRPKKKDNNNVSLNRIIMNINLE